MNNDNNIVRVYLLRDPFTNKIRYVGITRRSLEERLKNSWDNTVL